MIEPKPAASEPRSPDTHVRAEADAEPLARLWERIMSAVEAVPSLAVAIESMSPVERTGSTLRLKRPENGVKFSEVQREKLEGEIERLFGRRLRVEVVSERVPARPAHDDPPTSRGVSEREIDAAARARAMAHPVVKKAVELFDARVISVEAETMHTTDEVDDV